MNPMIRKELRQRLRDRRAWLLPSLYLFLLGAAVVFTYASSFQSRRPVQGADLGTAVFLTAAYAQLAVLLFILPVFIAGALTIEKEQRTLPALLTSLLSPAQIWWGKFVAVLLFQSLLLAIALPVLALAFALGGVGWLDVAAAIGATLLLLASISAVGLYCSSYFRRSVHATAVTYAIVVGLALLPPIAYGLLEWRQAAASTVPLLLSPFYALSGVVFGGDEGPALWRQSFLLFGALGVLAAVFAIRNIARSGEES